MKLDTVMIYVGETSLADCAGWYRQVLELEPADEGGSIWLRGEGGVGLGLHAGHVAPEEHAVELYFSVDDLDPIEERLRSANLDYDGPTEMPWGATTLHLHDPAGNAVWFMVTPAGRNE